MVEIVSKEEFIGRKKEFYRKIIDGGLFVALTDTIYGIFCDATNPKAVKRLRDLKYREKKPISVFAPSKQWIRDCCEVREEYLDRLPGPYTLIMKMKDNDCVVTEVNCGLGTLGVRIPDFWTKDLAKELGFPLVATSVNHAGKSPMTCLDDMDPEIKEHVDFIIDEGRNDGTPSTLINLTKEVPSETPR